MTVSARTRAKRRRQGAVLADALLAGVAVAWFLPWGPLGPAPVPASAGFTPISGETWKPS